jgi:signal transduction histidine kinase
MLEEGWAMVQEGINRLTHMSTDMLQYAKDWVPRAKPVDLTKTLKDIVNVIKQTAADQGVDVRLEITAPLPAVQCDSKMIHAAVMDVVSNAVDACVWKDYPDGETAAIVIRAYSAPEQHELVIRINDNGCGMTEDVKANIFTPFFSTKSKAGTGLGLALTSRAIAVHGGRIDVASEPDHGAEFRMTLPIDGTSKDKECTDGKKGPLH